MTNKHDELLLAKPEQETVNPKPQNRKVWVVPFSRTRLPSEPMKADSFGYDDWEIYHG